MAKKQFLIMGREMDSNGSPGKDYFFGVALSESPGNLQVIEGKTVEGEDAEKYAEYLSKKYHFQLEKFADHDML